MKDLTELEKAKLDLLTKDYDHRFSDVMFHSERYHRQVSFLQLYIAALLAVSGVRISGSAENLPEGFRVGSGVLKAAYLIFLILGACIAFYLVSNLLDALFMVYVNGARASILESKINDIVDDRLLIWETTIIPEMFDVRFKNLGVWIRVCLTAHEGSHIINEAMTTIAW